jgi:hypothetical protein
MSDRYETQQGDTYETDTKECPDCRGSGEIVVDPEWQTMATCETCGGSGTLPAAEAKPEGVDYETLIRAREALKRADDWLEEQVRDTWATIEPGPHSVPGLGYVDAQRRVESLSRVRKACDVANDAVFNVLNCLSSYLDDERAAEAIKRGMGE